ncbi:MAG: J domain-containing protein [Chloroflexales bacterium]
MDDFEQLDHYELLGISRGASADEIKQAYRQQMRRYHPDRVAAAHPEEQAYASRRALRINAAYQALNDLNKRSAYNHSLGGHTAPPLRSKPMTPQRPRDHQAELYDIARAHLDAGHAMQAAATLRELQKINPFYRDSAALLTQAEATIGPRPAHAAAPRPAPTGNRRSLLIGGIGSLLVAGASAATWWLRRTTTTTSAAPTTPTLVGVGAPSDAIVDATAAAPDAPPPSPPPSDAPPTIAPAIAPSAPPDAAPSPTPEQLAEDGRLLYAEDFSGDAWPTTSGSGWSVRSASEEYTISADPGVGSIWAYRTIPGGQDVLIGVDVRVSGGEAGLLLHYSDADNYLIFFVNPAGPSFRLEQHSAGLGKTLADESHPAIRSGADAINRLVARLEGDRIDLGVNGQLVVASLSSPTPLPGARYGMVAAAGRGPVTAHFSNLRLHGIAP